MAAAAVSDVDILSGVFAALWGVERGRVGDYRVVAKWIYDFNWGGGADFPVVFLLELDEDVWHGAWYDQLQTHLALLWHGGRSTRLGWFAQRSYEG